MKTPLYVASHKGYNAIVDILTAAGADVNFCARVSYLQYNTYVVVNKFVNGFGKQQGCHMTQNTSLYHFS